MLETVRVYAKRTDKVYLLLCLFSSAMAVLMLASWAAEQGGGFAVDEITGQITGIGDYRRALVQAGASGAGVLIALLLSTVDYRSLVKVWPFHVAFTWGLVLPTLFIHNLALGPRNISSGPWPQASRRYRRPSCSSATALARATSGTASWP